MQASIKLMLLPVAVLENLSLIAARFSAISTSISGPSRSGQQPCDRSKQYLVHANEAEVVRKSKQTPHPPR
jgi:hypothetical protein